MKMKVKKGDSVTILAGKDKGKTGTIERVLPKTAQVVVTGLNIIKKHHRARGSRAQQSGIISLPAPLAVSRVMILCPRCQKPTRVAISIDQEGTRHRTCKKCHETWA